MMGDHGSTTNPSNVTTIPVNAGMGIRPRVLMKEIVGDNKCETAPVHSGGRP